MVIRDEFWTRWSQCHLFDDREYGEYGEFGRRSRFGIGGGGGGGGPPVTPREPKAATVNELLAQAVVAPASLQDLGESLTTRMNRLLAEAFRSAGSPATDKGQVEGIVEASSDRARAKLPQLMAAARENLVAAVATHNKVDNAVALVNWRALEMVIALAETAVRPTEDFGSLVTEAVSPEDAESLSRAVFHHPLPARQRVADRRRILAATKG